MALPALHGELQALGQAWPLALAPGPGDHTAVATATLPDAPRILRLQLWCGSGPATAQCGDAVLRPPAVAGGTLAFRLEPTAGGHWQLFAADPAPAVPLWAQILPGLALGALVLVGARRRRGERP